MRDSLTKSIWNIEVWAVQKHVNLVDLVKSLPTNIYLQNLASIQKRTSPVKFAHLAEKSGKGSTSNPSTKVPPGFGGSLRVGPPPWGWGLRASRLPELPIEDNSTVSFFDTDFRICTCSALLCNILVLVLSEHSSRCSSPAPSPGAERAIFSLPWQGRVFKMTMLSWFQNRF